MRLPKIVKVVIVVALLFFIVCSIGLYLQNQAVNRLVDSVRDYDAGTKSLSDIKAGFPEDSSEYELFGGIEKLENGEYGAAQDAFLNAREKNGTNGAVSVYLAFYENECAYLQNGVGDYDAIAEFFDCLPGCRQLYNDTDLIWLAASTRIDTEENRKEMIELLQNFIDDATGISAETRLIIVGNIGMLHLMNDDYSDSVFAFRTVFDEAESVKDADRSNYLKIRALEYLGNLYEVLDELESAIAIYDRAIALEIGDKELEARAKYGAYINRNTCYIDLGEYEQARVTAEEAKAIIEYLPENMQAGVELFQYNNDAYLALSENDIATAEMYLEICYNLLEQIDKESFLNNELYVELTDLQITVKKGAYASALEKTEELLNRCREYDAGFRVAIYLSALEIYDQTEQMDLYVETATKLIAEKDAASHMLKKDYVQYVNSKYEMQLLDEENQRLVIIVLAIACLLLFVCLVVVVMVFYYKKLKQDTQLDGLTQVYNRKFLEKDLKRLFQRSLRNTRYGVLMIDIDYFKKFNDFYGHAMGDMVIKEVAASLRSVVRDGDLVIRYGGEEFLVLLKDANHNAVHKVCERMQREIAKKQIRHELSETGAYVSVSIGAVTGLVKDYQSLREYIKRADACMYESKQKGRNCFTVSTETEQ